MSVPEETSPRIPFRSLLVIATVGVLGSAFVLWGTDWPLGIPGEWEWQRIRHDDRAAIDLGVTLGFLLVSVLVYVVVTEFGRRAMSSEEATGARLRFRTVAWLLALTGAAAWWLGTVQESNPVGFAREKTIWVQYYPAASGYFHKSRFEIESLPKFLGEYEELMAKGDVLHVGTHPPGLFVLHRLAYTVVRDVPTLRSWLLGTASVSMREAADDLRRLEQGRVTEVETASLLLTGLLTRWLAAGSVIPLFLLVRRDFGNETAWRAAALWPLVPAVAVFLPKSDVLFAPIGIGVLLCWRIALDRRSVGWGIVTGGLFTIALCFSLVFLPVAAVCGWWWLGRVRFREPEWWRSVVGGAIGAMLVIGVVLFAFGLNLPNVWRWNYLNHAGFYEQFDRSYLGWLLMNPLELVIASGVPLLLLAATGLPTRTEENSQRRWDWWGPVLVWSLLWITGKNSGEAARLWVPMMAWLPWLTGSRLQRCEPHGYYVLFALQGLIALLTILRVFGFHFAQ